MPTSTSKNTLNKGFESINDSLNLAFDGHDLNRKSDKRKKKDKINKKRKADTIAEIEDTSKRISKKMKKGKDKNKKDKDKKKKKKVKDDSDDDTPEIDDKKSKKKEKTKSSKSKGNKEKKFKTDEHHKEDIHTLFGSKSNFGEYSDAKKHDKRGVKFIEEM